MSIWTSNVHKSTTDAAESLSCGPSGGRVKLWVLGAGLPLVPLGYGVRCLAAGQARFFGHRGSHIDVGGAAGVSLAIAYIAIGLFVHAHWFWGLHPRLVRFSPMLKALALIVFVVSFGYTMWRLFV